MIKFFRHIRKSLLSDGKFSRYLLYAIGEIILVVIGILLALQINAKYEATKKAKLKDVYIARLINDFKSDTLNINDIIARVTNCQEAIQGFIETLNADAADDRLYDTATRFFNSGWVIYDFMPSDNTFQDLSQTGHMSIIENPAVVEALISYDSFVKEFKEYHQINKDWITPLDQQVALKTTAFEIDGSTKELFTHADRTESMNVLRKEVKLLERAAAGHYWTNKSLIENLATIKNEAIKTLGILSQDQ